MKEKVALGLEPWKSGFEKFKASPQSQSTYRMRGPFQSVGRNPTVRQGETDSDSNAAYQCAVMWCITGDIAYANKSIEILNAWSSKLKSITGADAVLLAGLDFFKMANAAEVLRYTDSGWSEQDVRQCEQMFREVVYPVLKGFALFANGNWDTAAIKTVLAVAVFCNDRQMFETALRYYVDGAGDGQLSHYIYENGQCQESGRDQAHTQLGLAHLGDCCEIAWNQGLDLYAYDDNRLLKGFEYTAKYNLGEEVPFTPDQDWTGRYRHAVISRRGGFRPVFEEIYNHYVHRMGIAAPYTQRAAEKIRPESAAQGADHLGFGTLLFTCPPVDSTVKKPADVPRPPAGLVARGASREIKVTWIKSNQSVAYTVKRSTTPNGPFAAVASDIRNSRYIDAPVVPGSVYYYVVSAANGAGKSTDSLEVGACARLPAAWVSEDVGNVGAAGSTGFDGRAFTLEAAGADIGGTTDQLHFAHLPMNENGVITVRIVPQVAAALAKVGVMVRESAAADSIQVSLLLSPASSRAEAPGWSARLIARATSGAETTVAAASPNLPVPYVTFGRFMEPYWLRLSRADDTFTAWASPDGQTWTQVGTVTTAMKKQAIVGLAACSRITPMPILTRAIFDHVSAPGWMPGVESR